MNACIFYIGCDESSAISLSTTSQIKLLSWKIYIASTGKYSLNEIPLCFVTCNSVMVHVTYQDFLSNNANILRSNCTQIVQLDSVACPLAGFQIEYFAFPSSMEKSVLLV